MIRTVLLALVTACGLVPFPVHAAKSPYATHAECDGLPRVEVATPAGLCVGLVASGFKFWPASPGESEISVIERGAHYGWPYCYAEGVNSPEYPTLDCSRFRSPLRLLPAHAAPLGMAWYFGKLLPSEYHGALIVGYHGYREAGHRVVAFHVDQFGLPQGDAVELISGWDAREGMPMGAPTDVRVGADGAVYLTEDRNGTVLRLSAEHAQ